MVGEVLDVFTGENGIYYMITDLIESHCSNTCWINCCLGKLSIPLLIDTIFVPCKILDRDSLVLNGCQGNRNKKIPTS